MSHSLLLRRVPCQSHIHSEIKIIKSNNHPKVCRLARQNHVLHVAAHAVYNFTNNRQKSSKTCVNLYPLSSQINTMLFNGPVHFDSKLCHQVCQISGENGFFARLSLIKWTGWVENFCLLPDLASLSGLDGWRIFVCCQT